MQQWNQEIRKKWGFGKRIWHRIKEFPFSLFILYLIFMTIAVESSCKIKETTFIKYL